MRGGAGEPQGEGEGLGSLKVREGLGSLKVRGRGWGASRWGRG